MHLFDINIPGKIQFCESEVLHAGNELTTFETRMLIFRKYIDCEVPGGNNFSPYSS